jgi:ribosomal protein L32
MGKKLKGRWVDEPNEDDYVAAESFLTLIHDEQSSASFVKKLKKAEVLEFKAKDIFRASGLPLLGINNSHVKADQKRLVAGKKLSPLLLVRQTSCGKVIIADGYHRLCAAYSLDEDASIPCKIV